MSVSIDREPVLTERTAPVARGVERLGQGSFVLGSIGLLLAGAVDVLAVIGRHVGIPLVGSIEIVQACVVLMGSAALVGTTLQGGHATVHLLIDRLSPRYAKQLGRLTRWLSALSFILVAYGSYLVLVDLWHGGEQSELLGLPYAPLRFVFLASLVLVALLFLTAAGLGRARGGR